MQGTIGFTGTLSGQIDDSGSGGTSNYNELTNKPSINSVPLVGNKTTDDLHLFTGDYDDLNDKPSINGITLSGNKTTADLGLFSGNYNDLTNKPTLFSGNYDDLTNKPYIPDIDMAPAGAATEEVDKIELDSTVYEVKDAAARTIIGDGQLDPGFTATNLTGAANELKSNLTTLNNSLANYSRATAVTTLDTANGTFTATEAGYLWVYCVKNDDNSSSEYILQIRGINVLRYRVTGDVKVYNSFLIPMSKGDTVTCNTVTNMYQLATNNVKFIPRM